CERPPRVSHYLAALNPALARRLTRRNLRRTRRRGAARSELRKANVVFVDSHCHLNFPELAADLPAVLEAMVANRVTHALCISVTLTELPAVLQLAADHANLYATVGVHPDTEDGAEPSVAELVALAARPKVVAIGETGLDYYRLTGDLTW